MSSPGPGMLKALARGLLGRLVAYANFGLGFWFLFQGVQDGNIPLAVLGGVMIPISLYLLAKVRRSTTYSPADDSRTDEGGDSE